MTLMSEVETEPVETLADQAVSSIQVLEEIGDNQARMSAVADAIEELLQGGPRFGMISLGCYQQISLYWTGTFDDIEVAQARQLAQEAGFRLRTVLRRHGRAEVLRAKEVLEEHRHAIAASGLQLELRGGGLSPHPGEDHVIIQGDFEADASEEDRLRALKIVTELAGVAIAIIPSGVPAQIRMR